MIQYDSRELTKMVQMYIDELNYVKEPTHLYEPIKYVLGLGGKRIRPVLTLLAYNLFKADIEAAFAPAVAIETFHNFTLLHDDLMDRADLRRNKPTVHKKWDDNTAILSGDMMLILAYQWMAENVPTEVLKPIIAEFTKVSGEVCEGQQYDMDFETRSNVSVDEYMEMIRLKTSVLLAAALKIGALLGGAPARDAALLYEFGIKMGIAFQLQDDYLDVYANDGQFGKMVGGDILNNKKTFMLLKALQNASEQDRDELQRWIDEDGADAEEKVKAVTAIYNRTGIPDLCKNEIKRFYEEGLQLLAQVAVDEEKKMNLRTYVESFMNRNV